MGGWTPLLQDIHFFVSRAGIVIGLIMFAAGFYVGILRHGDVSPLFRTAVYAVVALMGVGALSGLILYAVGLRPYEEVHVIYGVGVLLSLPFFIYVEVTAKKRPAMGSYLWGFGLLVAIIVRSIVTGSAG